MLSFRVPRKSVVFLTLLLQLAPGMLHAKDECCVFKLIAIEQGEGALSFGKMLSIAAVELPESSAGYNYWKKSPQCDQIARTMLANPRTWNNPCLENSEDLNEGARKCTIWTSTDGKIGSGRCSSTSSPNGTEGIVSAIEAIATK